MVSTVTYASSWIQKPWRSDRGSAALNGMIPSVTVSRPIIPVSRSSCEAIASRGQTMARKAPSQMMNWNDRPRSYSRSWRRIRSRTASSTSLGDWCRSAPEAITWRA